MISWQQKDTEGYVVGQNAKHKGMKDQKLMKEKDNYPKNLLGKNTFQVQYILRAAEALPNLQAGAEVGY